MILITMMIFLMKASVKTMKIRLKMNCIFRINLELGWDCIFISAVHLKVFVIPVNTARIRQNIRANLKDIKKQSMMV